MIHLRVGLLLSLALLSPALLAGQSITRDPLSRDLFAPDLVMAYQEEIGLDSQQRQAIDAVILETQQKVLEVKWDLQQASERLNANLRAQPIDEAAVLAQADRVLELERLVKRAQLSLLVRVKNLLRPEQQSRLLELGRHDQEVGERRWPLRRP